MGALTVALLSGAPSSRSARFSQPLPLLALSNRVRRDATRRDATRPDPTRPDPT